MANRVFPANSLNLDGIPLTSTGVRPIQSPKLILNNRAPTPADANKSYPMGTIWVVLNRAAASPDNYEFWYLADNQSIPGALWLRFAVSPSGEFAAIFPTDNGTAFPIGTVLNIFGSNGGAPNHTGDNINTFVGSTTNTVVVALNHSLHMPASSADGTQGVWFTRSSGSPLSGGNIFISNIGTGNTFVGELSGNLTLTGADSNSGYGAGSLASLTTGDGNTTGGYVSGASISSGSLNTLYGFESGQSLVAANKMVMVGDHAGASVVSNLGPSVIVGSGAASALVSSLALGVTVIGYNALATATTSSDGQGCTVIGEGALGASTDAGLGTTAIGIIALKDWTSAGSPNQYNTAVGHAAGEGLVMGGGNTFLGGRAGNRIAPAASAASHNTAVGAGAMGTFGNTTSITGDNNSVLGFNAGGAITTGFDNCLFGYNAGTLLTTAGDSVAIGSGALQSETNGGGAVAIGFNALANTTASGASEAVAIGYQSQLAATKISSNTSVGYQTLLSMNGDGSTTAYQNTVMGAAGLKGLTTGVSNSAFGNGIAQNLTTGVNNCFFGSIVDPASSQVGGAYTSSESNNIVIMSSGVVGESNVIRIGNATGTGTANYNKCFISGIRGITTTAADAIAVLISSTGQLGTVSSSIRFKENVRNMNDDSSFIYDLRPVTFNYKDRTVAERSPGLIAEEVETVAPWLVARDMDGEIESVRYHELSVLLLNELKKLNHRVALLEDQLNDCSC